MDRCGMYLRRGCMGIGVGVKMNVSTKETELDKHAYL